MKRETREWLRDLADPRSLEVYRLMAADALATDAENKRLKAIEKWAKVAMKMELAFHCDGCGPDEKQCYICELATALKRKR